MRKFIIGFITILLGVLIYIALFKGVSIFKITVPSISDIKQMSVKLDETINEATEIVEIKHKQESQKLDEALTNLSEKRKEYERKLALCTPEEIEQATKIGKYDIEYLWAIIGNYASKEGIELKMDVLANSTSTTNNLNFTLNGSYIGIREFLCDIEEDNSLQFKIENFKLIPGSSTENLQATFTVREIAVDVDRTGTSESTVETTTETIEESAT